MFIGIYSRSQVSVYRAIGPLVQVVCPLLYAHCPIYSILLFEKHEQVLCCEKILVKVRIHKYGFCTCIDNESFRIFKLGGRAV